MLAKIHRVVPADPRIRSLFHDLKKNAFKGDLRSSYSDRITYATDNSIYQVLPLAVILPENKTDILILCNFLNQPKYADLSVTGRGGGTGTNGQSLTEGIAVDFSKYMNRILSINIDEEYAVIQPGVVLDALNRQLRPHGYFFAPSVSTANRATIGGMIGTDASGKGSRIYGKTSDHILSMECVLIDGTVFKTGKSEEVHPAVIKGLWEYLSQIKQEKSELIQAVFPVMNRSVTGYNLKDALLTSPEIDLNKLVSGSEGSLCFVTEIKVKITPVPKCRSVVLMKFPDFLSALSCTETIIQSNPDSIETVDDKILLLAMKDEVSKTISEFFDESETKQIKSFNLIEFSGNTEEETQSKIDHFYQIIDRLKNEINYLSLRVLPYSQSAGLWEMREKGVGLLANLPGHRKPIAFIEDCAVPPKNLLPFITEFKKLLDNHGLDYAMYGHVDVGCMHVRPAMDLKLPEDSGRIRELTNQVHKLALKYEGVLWGEHGKGYRGAYAPEFFGGELYGVMQKIKTILDPNNRLNPGKIAVPDQSAGELTQIDGVPLRGQYDRQIKESLASLFSASIDCNGNGLCFHHAPDYVMCPSFKENRDRIHSPKGRAGIIREWLLRLSQDHITAKKNISVLPIYLRKGFHQIEKMLGKYDFSHEVYSAMAGCLSCKACTTQCPVKVDIPEQKSMFLEMYHSRYPRAVRDYFIKHIETVGSFQCKMPRLMNAVTGFVLIRLLIKYTAGFRDIPQFSQPALSERLIKIPNVYQKFPPRKAPQKSVILVLDAFNTFYDAQSIKGTAHFLVKLGYSVFIPPFQPNGKTMHVQGFLDSFRRVARKNLDYLIRLSEAELPILFIEPSVMLTYRQEYVKYLPGKSIPPVYLLQEWLAKYANLPKTLPQNAAAKNTDKMYLLLHCTEQTSILNAGELWQKIFGNFGIPLDIIPTGCCGMAGAFGHKTEHYAASKGIYELSWKKIVREHKEKVLVTGYSCRSQVKRFDGFRPQYPAEFLNTVSFNNNIS